MPEPLAGGHAACPPDVQLLEVARRGFGGHAPGCLEHLADCVACCARLAALSRDVDVDVDEEAATRQDHPTDLPPAIGRYQVIRTLGAGQYGTVFEAYDPALDRTVAVKLLHTPHPGLENAALVREAQALAMLDDHHSLEAMRLHASHGSTLILLGQLQPGVQELAQADRIASELLGGRHPLRATILAELGRGLLELGQLDRAEAAIREAFAFYLERVGPAARDTCLVRQMVAEVLRARDDLAGARQLYEQNISLLKGREQVAWEVQSASYSSLAPILLELGQPVEAERAALAALRLEETYGPPNGVGASYALHALGTIARARGQLARAQAYLQHALRQRAATFGAASANAAVLAVELAELYLERERPAQAQPLLTAALQTYVATYGEAHPGLVQLHVLLADTLLAVQPAQPVQAAQHCAAAQARVVAAGATVDATWAARAVACRASS